MSGVKGRENVNAGKSYSLEQARFVDASVRAGLARQNVTPSVARSKFSLLFLQPMTSLT